MKLFSTKPKVWDSYGDDWERISNEVRVRDKYTCRDPKCRTYLGPRLGHVHHIIPRTRGGTDSKSNLILLCNDCHEDRHPHMKRRRKYP